MRTRFLVPITALLATAAVVAACSDSTGPRTDDSMTADQAARVAEMVAGRVGTLGVAGTSASVRTELAPTGGTARQTAPFELEADCPGGGAVAFSGRASATGDATGIDLEGELDYDGCTRTTPEGTVTLTTRPVFDVEGQFELVSATEVRGDTGMGGPFDWRIDGQEGSCELALDVGLEATAPGEGGSTTVSGTVTGRVCGHRVDGSFEAAA